MRTDNFMYDGQQLSSYGFIVCDFDYSDGTEITSIGSEITFNTIRRGNGRRYSLAGTEYSSCITSTFDVCKNPDIYEGYDRVINENEFLSLTRWLNRNEFLEIVFEGDDGEYRKYHASFNIEKIRIGRDLVGLRLNMETDSPFAYGEHVSVSHTFSGGDTWELEELSNDIGEHSPDISITLMASDDLTISNDLTNSTMVINGCNDGEVISINGSAQIIETSLSTHDIWNDFNYEFLRIGNTSSTRINTITASAPCTVNIQYDPIVKDTPLR